MKQTEYQKALATAVKKGWKIPQSSPPCGEQSWVNYWRCCAEYERDPSSGRPVVPHRSA